MVTPTDRPARPDAIEIAVDEHRCVGAGRCAWVAPNVFDQRPADGIVVLRAPRPTADDAPFAREAAELCPAGAIRITQIDPRGDEP